MADRNLDLVIQSVQNEFQARATVLCCSRKNLRRRWSQKHRILMKSSFKQWISPVVEYAVSLRSRFEGTITSYASLWKNKHERADFE